MGNTKPFVQAACVCENVIFDKSAVASLIRIVDRFNVELPDPLPAGIPGGFPLKLFVSVKSGDVTGNSVITIKCKRPDGTILSSQEVPITLNGGSHGMQIATTVHIIGPVEGIYWFDVLWGDELLTSIPAQVTVKRVPFVPSDQMQKS